MLVFTDVQSPPHNLCDLRMPTTTTSSMNDCYIHVAVASHLIATPVSRCNNVTLKQSHIHNSDFARIKKNSSVGSIATSSLPTTV